jgi:hypothetical protein
MELLEKTSYLANIEMINAKNREEFIFYSGMYIGVSSIFIMIKDNLSMQVASMLVNDYVEKIAIQKYGNKIKNLPI